MIRKILLVLLFVVFPIYVSREDGNIPQRKMSLVRQVPSMITGILSMCALSGQKKKMFYVFLTVLFITVDVTILCMYAHDSRQKSYESPYAKRLSNGTKSARVDDNGKETTSATLCNGLKARDLHDSFNVKDGFNVDDVIRKNPICRSRVKKEKHVYSQLSRTLKGHQDQLPWYLELENNFQHNSTDHVYPLSLNHYFDEVLQNNPRSVLMKYEWARFASYNKFPLDSPARPVRLAQAGFYYKEHGDAVECFSCNVTYGNWQDGDDPSSIHKQINPHCAFVTGEDRTNVPIHENRGVLGPQSEEPGAVAAPTTVSTDGAAVKKGTSNIEVKQHCGFGGKNDYSFREQGAKHPDYADGRKRMESFKDWPCSHIVSKEDLVAAGFAYAGVDDCVRCFYCGLGLRNWEVGDGPWEEHARWAQKCQYVLEKKGVEFVRQHATEPDNIPCTRPKPAAPSATSNVPKQQPSRDVPAKSNIHELKKQETNQSTNETASAKTKPNDTVKQQKQDSINNTKSHQYPASVTDLKLDAKYIKDENTKLKSQVTCKVCMDRETNTVVLPCGHFVSCFPCSQHLRKCAICRTKIEGRVKVSLS